MTDFKFEVTEVSDELLEQVSGGMMDLFDGKTITITVEDFAREAKAKGMTLDAAKAEMQRMFDTLGAAGIKISPNLVNEQLAKLEAIW